MLRDLKLNRILAEKCSEISSNMDMKPSQETGVPPEDGQEEEFSVMVLE